MAIATRDQLHQLIDKLPEDELGAAKQYLERLQASASVPAILVDAAEEDEPVAPGEAAALAEADAQVARGEVVADEDFDLALARARQRVGDWRVLFRFARETQTMVVLRVLNRRDAYRD